MLHDLLISCKKDGKLREALNSDKKTSPFRNRKTHRFLQNPKQPFVFSIQSNYKRFLPCLVPVYSQCLLRVGRGAFKNPEVGGKVENSSSAALEGWVKGGEEVDGVKHLMLKLCNAEMERGE
ncbi:hypothetical protein CEXT_774461 [Caerostris extrusa]|uniref:Uncharacterized protein n=1 Tax=Caerostris extrusa TaxID=172846 RepID=A0AAV4MBI8_CAEEX|nr:hypothetical protein CEXT_774461 [Caerostris extrusa]